MTNLATATKPEVQADYQVKGRDLRQAYAAFCRRPLGDRAIWCLSLASSTLPDNHIGYEAWITEVSGADCHADTLRRWCVDLAEAAATLKPKLGERRRQLVECYRPDWGATAALDGLQMALCGLQSVPSYDSRADHYRIRWQAYKRIRDLVAGCVILQMAQYEDALAWAVRTQRFS